MALRKATRPVVDKVEIEEEEAPSTLGLEIEEEEAPSTLGLDAVAAFAMQGTPCSPAVLQPGSGQTRTDSDKSLVGDATVPSSGSNIAMGRQSSLSSIGGTSSPNRQPQTALTWEQAQNRWKVGHGGDAGSAGESQWGAAPPPPGSPPRNMADMAAHTNVSSRRLTVDSPHLAHLLRRCVVETLYPQN